MGQVGRIDGQSPGDRKDTPWQRMSDAELQQAVAAASGRVMIGFKDPEAAMGVDNAGRVLARSQSTRDAVARLRSTNAAILYEFERMPAVVAKIRMTADIAGPLFAYTGYSQTWSASVSGGQSPYAYQWYVDGTPSGTGSSLNYTPGSSDFWLKLSVVDNLSYGAVDSIHVEVSGCTPPIIFC